MAVRIAWNKLTIAEAEARFPDMAKGQKWQDSKADYWFECLAGLKHPRYSQCYNGHHNGHGCPECGNIAKNADRRSSTADFIAKAREKHGDKYDYSQVVYLTSGTKVRIVCPTPGHGLFSQRPSGHLRGRGCIKCAIAAAAHLYRYTWEELAATFPDLVPGQTSYQNTTDKLLWKCLAGKGHPPYPQAVSGHQQGQGCPKCKRSRGEIALEKAAVALGITDYEEGKWFPDCRNSNPLPFDGASESLRVLFEFHGIQHYRQRKHFGGIKIFRKQQHHDRIKKRWARNNDWQLIVVPYRIKNIEAYLRKRLFGTN